MSTKNACLLPFSNQILPKHTLEAVLVGLCRSKADQNAHTSGWEQGASRGGGSNNSPRQGSCVWTELTMPVITAALNLKPALSDTAIAVLVRRVEMASERPQLQVRKVSGVGWWLALCLCLADYPS